MHAPLMLPFYKYQGLGNDFILVNQADFPVELDGPRIAQQLCDRHFGIGADGLIVATSPRQYPEADARMQIWNADGSEPEMCGNGLRCLARYLADIQGLSHNPQALETGAGLLRAEIHGPQITIDMGVPILQAIQIPATGWGEGPVINQPLEDTPFQITLVSMGNPHCVIFVPSLTELDFEYWGPRLEKHPAFPRKANIEFVEILAFDNAHVKVWERGAGATLACGTGACAVLVAGVLNNLLASKAQIELPGGPLQIHWPEPSGPVWMSGPATCVYQGQVKIDRLQLEE